jgi:hypothetical protein
MPNQFPTIGECIEPSQVSPPSLPSCWTCSSMATIGRFNAPKLATFSPRINHVPPVVSDRSAMSAPEFDLVPLRTPEGLILYFKHQESPWTFRVIPVRDPDQPRLWCLRLEPCAGPSLNAITARVDPFYTSLAMTREQLTATLDSIRQSTGSWLAEHAQQGLQQWLARIVILPTPSDFVRPEPPARSTRLSPASPGIQGPQAALAPLRKSQ